MAVQKPDGEIQRRKEQNRKQPELPHVMPQIRNSISSEPCPEPGQKKIAREARNEHNNAKAYRRDAQGSRGEYKNLEGQRNDYEPGHDDR